MSELGSRALSEEAGSRGDGGTAPEIVVLTDPRALDVALTGSKAAALAKAAVAGIDTLPGVVLTTSFTAVVDAGGQASDQPAVRRAFDQADGDRHPLVARSSSVLEDTAGSSMAGQFDSVIGIPTFDAFTVGVQSVLDSRVRAGVPGSPIAVLVQPLIEPRYGGVMFGVDPVTGRTDRRMVSAVEGGPEPLVSGEVDGSRYVLDIKASVVEFDPRRRTGAAGARAPPTGGPVRRGRRGLRRSAGRGVGGRARTGTSGSCSRGRSPPRSEACRSAPSTAPVRSPRPSPSRWPSSSTTCGSRRCATRCGRPSCSLASPPRRRSRPAGSSCRWPVTSPSTCDWPARSCRSAHWCRS